MNGNPHIILLTKRNQTFEEKLTSIKNASSPEKKQLLKRYLSENGKILPSRITSVSQKKQRELSLSIKRARNLALI